MKTSFSCKFYLFLPAFAAFLLFGCTPVTSKPSPTPSLESTVTTESTQPTPTTIKPDMQLMATLGKGSVSGIFHSPDGKIVFVGKAGELSWYDAKTFNQLGAVQLDIQEFADIIFSSNPDIVAVNGFGGDRLLAPVVDLKNQMVLTTTNGNKDDYLFGFLLSPDGNHILYRRAGYASDRQGQWIELWNTGKDKLERQFLTNAQAKKDNPYVAENMLSDPALSPDGKWVAAGCSDNLIYIWDAHTGKTAFTLKADVASVAFSPDGSLLASGGADETVRIWDMRARILKRTITAPSKVSGVSFSADGATLTLEFTDRSDQALDLATGQFAPAPRLEVTPDPFTVQLHRQGYSESFTYSSNEVAVSPDGNTLAIASRPILLWDIRRGQLITSLENPMAARGAEISEMIYSPNSAYLAALASSNDILVWDTRTGQSLSTSTDPASMIWNPNDGWARRGLAFSPDSALLAVGRHGSIEFWDMVKAQQSSTLELTNPADIVMEIQFSKSDDQIYILVGSKDTDTGAISDKAVQTWDLKTGKLLRQTDLPAADRSGVLHWPFFARVNSDFQKRWIELWNLETGQFTKLETPSFDITPMIFSSDGSLLIAMTDFAQNIYIWKTNTGELVYTFHHEFFSSGLSTSPDSGTLVVGQSGIAEIWDIHQIAQAALMPVITPAIVPTSIFWRPTPTPTKSP
ncbi:MAG: hypothetical protein WA821_11350 [Anaerolineales bacterium]